MSWSFLHFWQADISIYCLYWLHGSCRMLQQHMCKVNILLLPGGPWRWFQQVTLGLWTWIPGGGIDRFQDSQGVKPTSPVWRLFKFAIQLFFASCFPRCHCRLLLVKLLTLPLASTKCFSIFFGSCITFTWVKGHLASFKDSEVVFRRQRNLQGSCWKSPK